MALKLGHLHYIFSQKWKIGKNRTVLLARSHFNIRKWWQWESTHMLFFLLTETSIFMCIMNEAQFLGYEINIITSVVQVLFDNNGQKSTMSKCILVIYSWYYRNAGQSVPGRFCIQRHDLSQSFWPLNERSLERLNIDCILWVVQS